MTANGLLSEHDGEALHEARLVLHALSQAASKTAYVTTKTEAADLARLAEACFAAEDGIFRVINVAMSYLQDPVARAAHEEWMARYKEPVEA